MDLKISDLTAGTITSNDWVPIERSASANYRLNLETAITSKALSLSAGGTVTGNVTVTGEVSATDVITTGLSCDAIIMAGTIRILTGNGTPEGFFTADPGSLYMSDGGGASTSLYIKESGSGTANWKAVPNTGGPASFSSLTIGTTTSQITGAAGNMTITAGTGASRTMTLQTTNSGSTAKTVMTLKGDQSIDIGSYDPDSLNYQNVKLYNFVSSDGYGILGFCQANDIIGAGVGLGSEGLGVILDSDQALTWTSTSSISGSISLVLLRDSAATLQLGFNHPTAATAQTIKAHDITSSGNGASLTIAGGKGDALSSGGSVILATSTSSGTAAARLTCSADGTSVFSGTFGYGAGSGSSVTQTSGRTQFVNINASSGSITLVSAAGSTTPFSFVVNNTKVKATDVVVLSQKFGADKYILLVTAIVDNYFEITAYTTGGTTNEAPEINFAIIKGSTS